MEDKHVECKESESKYPNDKTDTAQEKEIDIVQELDGLEPAQLMDFFENVPDEMKTKLSRVFAMSYSMTKTTPETNAVNKLTPEHITQYLSGSEKAMEHEYEDRDKSRKHQLWLLAMAGVFLVVFILLLKSNPELLEKLAYAFVGLIGGYGFGRYKREE